MLHFTTKQVQELIDIIENTHWYFIATHINPDLVPNRIMKDLVKMGFKKSQILKYPELAMQFGMLSVFLKDKDNYKLTFEQLKKIVKAKKFVPLSNVEKFALHTIEERAMSDIKGLGNKISKATHTILIEADLRQRHRYEKIIKEAAVLAVKKREGIKFIAREIAEKTNDWARDLDRIGDYILHEAYDTGRALSIRKQKGGDAKVYKRVHPKACDSCKKIFLKDIKTGEPRIFEVDELLENGTNVGKKKEDWQATIGPIHPWCRCDIFYVPLGHVWSNKSQRFVPDESLRNKNIFSGKIKTTITKD